MRIVTLVENTSSHKKYKSKHGLSLYIETAQHKVLFDIGKDDTFLYNAEKLNIDIKNIDTVVISHGHFDHGGALQLFYSIMRRLKFMYIKMPFRKYVQKYLVNHFM